MKWDSECGLVSMSKNTSNLNHCQYENINQNCFVNDHFILHKRKEDLLGNKMAACYENELDIKRFTED